ncbi:hypothetical protein D4764_01G0007500 [Takifugu flavidus]|uniref:Ig-like domain-containing protein n=1 Tax=Takifugu flavidus TaxID=433684 RepID=A0A5C6PND7_9TELE|nr:hypothetical protein D4764_01G0007500 [Takifugu flavidus]
MHSDFVSLRNSMFHLNQAALLFILQLFMWKVFAGVIPPEQRNLTVVRGETVTLNCNVTMENITLTEWYKDKIIFVYQHSTKRKFSDLPPDRLQMNIDTNSQSTLKLLNAQPDDAGYYRCIASGLTGVRRIVWNLLVSEGPEGEGDHRTTDENNQLAREQEEESLRGEAQFNLRSIGLQNRTAV